ncbi:MAG: hypothetical protein ACFFAO_07800 [Candidatus Hermodarchaeota archaeon]
MNLQELWYQYKDLVENDHWWSDIRSNELNKCDPSNPETWNVHKLFRFMNRVQIEAIRKKGIFFIKGKPLEEKRTFIEQLIQEEKYIEAVNELNNYIKNAQSLEFTDFVEWAESQLTHCNIKLKEKMCDICSNKIKEFDCPDCGRTVCVNCWDESMAICVPCKKKLEFLKEGATPTPTEAVQSSQTTQIPDKERYLKLRNALQASEETPLSILTKSLKFSSTDDLCSWLIECGIIGLKVDYKEKMVKMTDPEALEMLEILIQEKD